jgi:hypothetical protein
MLGETYGGPGYPAVFEVLHQLHCVDLLRKSSYFNAPYYLDLGVGPFKDPEKQLKPHIGQSSPSAPSCHFLPQANA